MMTYPWSGKLHHSRNMPDDWGCIRDDDGRFVFKAMILDHNEWVLNEHRRNKTDPTQPLVDALLLAVNGDAPQSTTPTVPGWKDVISALVDCRIELGYIIEQTGAREGGSVFNAYKKADSVLAALKSGPIPEPEGWR